MIRLTTLALVLGGLPLLGGVARAADPLYLVRPFDEITLDENNGGARLKVLPLPFPGRKLPAPADRKDDLEIELVDRPGERFRVGWNNIVGIRFFEEMVLAEAQTLVKEERYDDAYPYFQLLESKHPKTAGLKDAVEDYLWAQMAREFKEGRNESALALAVELHRRNPQRQGLGTALERVTVKLVEGHLAAENYRAARGLLLNLTQRYPDSKATAAEYETQMRDKAAAALDAARQALASEKYREAHQAARRAISIWPAVDGGRELAQQIHRKYPTVSIGVTSLRGHAAGIVAGGWAARRTDVLLARRLFARTSTADDDSGYQSAMGELVKQKNPRQVVLRLRPGTPWPGSTRPLAAHDAARWLLAAADARQPSFDAAWADLLSSVAVRSENEVLIELARPALAPAAWLGAVVVPVADYRVDAETPQRTIFVRMPSDARGETTPPHEVVERVFADSAAAMDSLRRGDVQVLDRISPWELNSLADRKEIVVDRYALPTVHVLVPNPRRPLAENRTLKRAILYAIDRESILHLALLNGQEVAGCATISGPFPRGESKNDPHGYAYDESVSIRPYDPGLALALLRMASLPDQTDSSAVAGAAAPGQPAPPLVLVHLAEPIARVACLSIARQLKAAGMNVTLREQDADSPLGDDYDLVYEELPMTEPLVDVWRLLGPQGIAGTPTPAMLAALRELESTGDLFQASQRLRAIHALAAAELPVIPLWQLVDHFAVHASLTGAGQRPMSLYQNIDRWQIELKLPSE